MGATGSSSRKGLTVRIFTLIHVLFTTTAPVDACKSPSDPQGFTQISAVNLRRRQCAIVLQYGTRVQLASSTLAVATVLKMQGLGYCGVKRRPWFCVSLAEESLNLRPKMQGIGTSDLAYTSNRQEVPEPRDQENIANYV